MVDFCFFGSNSTIAWSSSTYGVNVEWGCGKVWSQAAIFLFCCEP